jgi:hypothetical protein
MIDTQAPPPVPRNPEPKLRRFKISIGPETRSAVIAVSSHAPIGRDSTRLVPRTEAQIRSRAEALARDYFGVKWAIKVIPIDEGDV